MATNYTGNATPTLNNAPANSWATDAEKRSHVGNTYLVTGSGGTSGNVYAFEEYPSAVVKEVPASGLPAEIVTITDGGENLPMTSAEVSLSPQQDLNGFDSPWPGGGGKNLLNTNDFADYTNNGVTWHRNDDGSVVLNGTATARSYKYLNGGYYLKLEPGTYTASVSGLESGGPFGNIAYSTTENGTYAGTFGTLGGTISKRTFTVENTIYLGLLIDVPSGATNSNRLIKIQIEEGSTATEWSPYSNICPISGHTGATLVRSSENMLFPSDFVQGSINNSGAAFSSNARIRSAYIAVEPNTQYAFEIGDSLSFYEIHEYVSANGVNTKYTTINSATGTITTVSTTNYIRVLVRYSNNAAVDPSRVKAVQMRKGSTTNLDEYSITFTDQGTVYGGTYDFVSGKLTVEWKSVNMGDLTWNYAESGTPGIFRFAAGIADIALGGNTSIRCMCSQYPVYLSTVYNRQDKAMCSGSTNAAIFVRDDSYHDAATFKQMLTDNNAHVVYELATPLEYTLSAQQIETLLGENNVWSDAGEISNLVYRSNQYVMAYDWFETWTMPKITRNNGNIIVLPYPQEYTPEIYDVDASTTGRNAAGTMIRDRVAVKHKFNYRFPPLSQADATEILNAVRDSSFTLTTASPETGAKTNYRVYVGDRSLPVYWMPTHNNASWLYSSLTLNLIEM